MNSHVGTNPKMGGFDRRSFSYLASREASHFWFKARNQIILWALDKLAGRFETFLEIGCGTGFVLEAISRKFPATLIFGGELHSEGLEYAKKRLPKADLFQLDATQMFSKKQIDCIGAFDVLEHINQDELVLENIYNVLVPGGILVVTVPQHPFLWSMADEVAQHVRRYTAEELHQKLQNAGFQLLFSSSFVTLLFPFLVLSRAMNPIKREHKSNSTSSIESSELEINSIPNFIFEKIMKIELLLIKLGIRYPFGGSRIVVCRKFFTNDTQQDVELRAK